MIMKIKIKDQEINIPEGATFEVVDGDLVVTPKIWFKEGDILHSDWGHENITLIFKNSKYNRIYYHISKSEKLGLKIDDCYWDDYSDFRLATEEEKQILFDKLKKQGKRWNSETKQIEDILKVGDLAIFWDDDKKEACIATYTEVKYPHCTPDGFNYVSTIKDEECNVCWKNAIKCTSLEQYINFKK